MTEPKRWDASNCVRFCDRCDAEYGITAGADAGDEACSGCGADAPHVYPRLADFVRLRDERDEARRVAGVLADALREIARFPCQYPDDPDEDRKMAINSARAGSIASSALAVFDTLTEEKTARAREGGTE